MLFFGLTLLVKITLFGQENLIIVHPTGEFIGEMPVMERYSDASRIGIRGKELSDRTFIGTIANINRLAQNYLVNTGQKRSVEPAYMGLTQNQGGFARQGFVLKTDSGNIHLPHTYYVDIIEKTILQNPSTLMSVTQLFPHEMGHALFGLLAKRDSLKSNSRSLDVHFFSIVTDRNTAFNEGFAEHIENISRLFEPQDSVRVGIEEDANQIEKKWVKIPNKFRRDFVLPIRLGYYKMTMLVWYQQLEDLKRYRQSLDGSVRYKPTSLRSGDIEDRLTYRNAAVQLQNGQIRNYAQVLASEGSVSAFFTAVMGSDLKHRYLDPIFYKPFLDDTSRIIENPALLFSPLENQFIKYFVIFNKYMNKDNSVQGQWIDFMNGYLDEFPEEESEFLRVFYTSTGHEFLKDVPASLWMLVKGHEHRLLVFDAYGGIRMPNYTFELNAAEIEDILTIEGLSQRDAEIIIDFRNQHGFFKTYSDILNIPELSESAKNGIIEAQFDETYFEAMSEPDLNIFDLIVAPLKVLALRLIFCFIGFMLLMYLFFYRKEERAFWNWLVRIIGNLLLWSLWVLMGLTLCVLFTSPEWVAFGIGGIVMLFSAFIFRKKKDHMQKSMVFLALMNFIIFWSLW